jgi:hypothetical protein
VLEGSDLSPQWPSANGLGQDRRAGNRSEEYVLVFRANDRDYTYTTSSLDRFRQLAQGETYRLKVNAFGQITEISPP